jgi:ubiquinone/menaquinone biosynthesis C-methylase UbiE
MQQLIKLDYGCGSGGFEEIAYPEPVLNSWLMANSGPNSYGIDINPLRIESAKQRINNGTKLIVMDGRKLDFPDNYFDVVHEWAVFHHMPDFTDGVKEVHRVLKPGGIFLMTESVDNDVTFRLMRRIFNKWNDDDVSSYFDTRLLNSVLRRYFMLDSHSYHWRFLLSDFLREYHLEPRFSLVLNDWISKVFNSVGLGEKTCCHYSVRAINIKKRSESNAKLKR